MDLSGGPAGFAADVGAARNRVARIDYAMAARRLADAVVDAVALARSKEAAGHAGSAAAPGAIMAPATLPAKDRGTGGRQRPGGVPALQ